MFVIILLCCMLYMGAAGSQWLSLDQRPGADAQNVALDYTPIRHESRVERRSLVFLNATQSYLTVPEKYPIRFNVIYQLPAVSSGTITQAEFSLLQSDLVPAAVRRMARIIDLKRQVNANLTLARGCKTIAEWRWGQVGQQVTGAAQTTSCLEYYQPKCGQASIPDAHFSPAKLCTTNGPDDCSDLPSGYGITGADVIVYVTVDGTGPGCALFTGVKQVASGQYCYRDQYDRPVAINLNICPGMLNIPTTNDLTAAKRSAILNALFRGLFQGLAFDLDLVARFRDRATDQPLVPRNASNYPTGSQAAVLATATTGGGAGRTIVVTPTVVKEAKAYLGCTSLPGAEVSTLSLGASTLLWADRVFGGELMAAGAVPTAFDYPSNMSLALLYDSGWYYPDFSLASLPRFTLGAQCPVYNFDCSTTATASSIPYPFCKPGSSAAGRTCDLGRRAALSCPSAAGPFDDGCTVQSASDDAYICAIQTQTLSGASRTRRTSLENYGESFGPNSICISVSFTGRTLTNGQILTFASEGAGCYRARCSTVNTNGFVSTVVQVFVSDPSDTVNGGTWAACPFSTSKTTTDLRDIGFSAGLLGTCPDPLDVCGRLSCPSNCNGNGVCDDKGACRCDPGWAGADCSKVECYADADCPINQSCSADAGYCINTPSPPSPPAGPPPPPPRPAVTYTLAASSQAAGALVGCSALLDADGDGQPQNSSYDSFQREIVATTDSGGGAVYTYDGNLVRIGVIPRNYSLVPPARPQVLVQTGANCKDSLSGQPQWGDLRTIHIEQTLGGLSPAPYPDLNNIRNNQPELLSSTIADPFTTLAADVFFLLQRNYSAANVSVPAPQVYAEATYRVASALNALFLDPRIDVPTLNSSIIQLTRYVDSQVVAYTVDLSLTAHFGRLDLLRTLKAGYTGVIPTYTAGVVLHMALTQIASVAGTATVATSGGRAAYRAAVIALAEEVIAAGDNGIVAGLDDYLLKAVIDTGGWRKVQPPLRIPIILRAAQRVDLSSAVVIQRVMARAAARLADLNGFDAGGNLMYVPANWRSLQGSGGGRRLLQTPSALQTAIAQAAAVTSYMSGWLTDVAGNPTYAGLTPAEKGTVVAAAAGTILNVGSGRVATYINQLRTGDISTTAFQTLTAQAQLQTYAESGESPASSTVNSTTLLDFLSGNSASPTTAPSTTPKKDHIQNFLYTWWWVGAIAILLIIFLLGLGIFFANRSMRRKMNRISPETREKEKLWRERDAIADDHPAKRGPLEEQKARDAELYAKAAVPQSPAPNGGRPRSKGRDAGDLRVEEVGGTSQPGAPPYGSGNGKAIVPVGGRGPPPGAQADSVTLSTAQDSGGVYRSMKGQVAAEREREAFLAGSLVGPKGAQAALSPTPAGPPPPAQYQYQGPPGEYPSPPPPRVQGGFAPQAGAPPPRTPPPPPYQQSPVSAPGAPPPAYSYPPASGSGEDATRARPPPADFRVPAPPSMPPPPPPVLSLSTTTALVAASLGKMKARSTKEHANGGPEGAYGNGG